MGVESDVASATLRRLTSSILKLPTEHCLASPRLTALAPVVTQLTTWEHSDQSEAVRRSNYSNYVITPVLDLESGLGARGATCQVPASNAAHGLHGRSDFSEPRPRSPPGTWHRTPRTCPHHLGTAPTLLPTSVLFTATTPQRNCDPACSTSTLPLHPPARSPLLFRQTSSVRPSRRNVALPSSRHPRPCLAVSPR